MQQYLTMQAIIKPVQKRSVLIYNVSFFFPLSLEILLAE